ncbi:MAG TPA: ABC transporter permease, partial [Blastocatellia bacterium]|nr:ABC transporter permease [Blastocatellia bacterium]
MSRLSFVWIFEKTGELFRRLVYYMRRESFDRELREEMDFHLYMTMRENRAPKESESSESAYYAARRQFGNRTLLQEASREMWGFRSLETLLQDVKYAGRLLVKNPGFAVAAIGTLAIGIGLNSAIFSVINSHILRPLPFKHSDQLVQLWESTKQAPGEQFVVSPANLADWRKQATSFESLGGYNIYLPSVAEPTGAIEVGGAVVTTNFFEMLGVSPALGRTFSPDEDQQGKNHVVIVSNKFWRTRLGGKPDAIGQSLVLDEAPSTIIGVLPETYRHPEPRFDETAELFRPLLLNENSNRGSHYLRALGRLKPGISIDKARAEMAAIAAGLEKSFPGTNTGLGVTLVPLRKQYSGDVQLPLMILQGAALLVLLIACVNIANLLLARISVREREIAVRSALGAGRLRLIRSFLTESLLLSAIGAGAGLALAYWFVRVLASFAPRSFERMGPVNPDFRVVGFTLFVSVTTVLLFGLAPALRAARLDISRALKEGRGLARRQAARGAMVTAEIAIALVLLIGAGLMLRSLASLQAVPLGFNPENLITMHLALPGSIAKDDEKTANAYRQILSAVRSLPGVQSAAVTSSLPLDGLNDLSGAFTIEGQPPLKPGEEQAAGYRMVSPGYFATMGISLLKGRDFADQDTKDSTPVAMINQTLARRYFNGVDPLGKRLTLSSDDAKTQRVIIGVVGDFKFEGLELPIEPETYVPHAQNTWSFMALAVRTNTRPEPLIEAVENAIWGLEKDAAPSRVKTMGHMLSAQTSWIRFYLLLLGIFAAVALALAAVGIYGVMSCTVQQNTREIGIRLALGAESRDALGLIIRRGMLLTILGVALGLGGAF